MRTVRSVFSLVLLVFALPALGCVSTNVVVPKRLPPPRLDALLVLVHEGTFGRGQAESFAAALQKQLAHAHLDAHTVVVGRPELNDEAALTRAREGRHTLLRIVPIAGTHLFGEASRIRYDASLYALPEGARLWNALLEGRSGVLNGPLRRRNRRLARGLVAALTPP